MTAAPSRTRRDFVRAVLFAAAGLAGRAPHLLASTRWPAISWMPAAASSRPGRRSQADLVIGLFVDGHGAPSDDARRWAVRGVELGVELGVAEAMRAAALLGGAIRLVPGAETIDAARRLVQERRLSALLVATDAERSSTLAAACDEAEVLCMNIASSADALRGERCRRSAFHIAASDAMARDAYAEWERQRSTDGPVPARAKPRVESWHASLERYGAGQLNDRFRARFDAQPDSTAWAAWLAVKIVWEASRRARTVEPAKLAEHLEREGSQFDGHKGVPLSFRRWDHQLRQPLYLIAPGDGGTAEQVLFEAPVRARDGQVTTREALDRLGTGEGGSQCRWR